jgi:hypothetical protein
LSRANVEIGHYGKCSVLRIQWTIMITKITEIRPIGRPTVLHPFSPFSITTGLVAWCGTSLQTTEGRSDATNRPLCAKMFPSGWVRVPEMMSLRSADLQLFLTSAEAAIRHQSGVDRRVRLAAERMFTARSRRRQPRPCGQARLDCPSAATLRRR